MDYGDFVGMVVYVVPLTITSRGHGGRIAPRRSRRAATARQRQPVTKPCAAGATPSAAPARARGARWRARLLRTGPCWFYSALLRV